MLFFDGIHLMADPGEASSLCAFARLAEIPDQAFQPHPTHPHYDVLAGRVAAVRSLARLWRSPGGNRLVECSARELVAICVHGNEGLRERVIQRANAAERRRDWSRAD